MTWERWLSERFSGYLLPASHLHTVDMATAARFLARLSGRPDHLRLVCATALAAQRTEALRRFAWEELPDLVRTLPSRTDVVRRTWEGGFQGRLDVRATLAERLSGSPTRFITRSRRRSFALPQTVLLVAAVRRLRDLLGLLRRAGVMGDAGWARPITDVERQLTRMLDGTMLRDVPDERIGPIHLQAARQARHRAYRSGAHWFRQVRTVVEAPDPERLAHLLQNGALGPVAADTRFELAVLLRLVEGCWARAEKMEPGQWRLEQGLVLAGRKEVARLSRQDGAEVAFFYDQAVLPVGPRDLAARTYLDSRGHMRPDLTVRVRSPSGATWWMVVEVKLSDDPAYWRQGLSEAFVYRHEYAPFLTGWPKAVLVYSGANIAAPRIGDDVVAVGWGDWAPEAIVSGLMGG